MAISHLASNYKGISYGGLHEVYTQSVDDSLSDYYIYSQLGLRNNIEVCQTRIGLLIAEYPHDIDRVVKLIKSSDEASFYKTNLYKNIKTTDLYNSYKSEFETLVFLLTRKSNQLSLSENALVSEIHSSVAICLQISNLKNLENNYEFMLSDLNQVQETLQNILKRCNFKTLINFNDIIGGFIFNSLSAEMQSRILILQINFLHCKFSFDGKSEDQQIKFFVEQAKSLVNSGAKLDIFIPIAFKTTFNPIILKALKRIICSDDFNLSIDPIVLKSIEQRIYFSQKLESLSGDNIKDPKLWGDECQQFIDEYLSYNQDQDNMSVYIDLGPLVSHSYFNKVKFPGKIFSLQIYYFHQKATCEFYLATGNLIDANERADIIDHSLKSFKEIMPVSLIHIFDKTIIKFESTNLFFHSHMLDKNADLNLVE